MLVRASQVALVIKSSPTNAGDVRDVGSIPGWGDALEEGITPVFLPGESHGQRSMVGYSPQVCQESGQDWSDRMHACKELVKHSKLPICSTFIPFHWNDIKPICNEDIGLLLCWAKSSLKTVLFIILRESFGIRV